jgi:SpoVK/Ycf46/Vps4 family AAA+-type ATPase
VEYSLEILKIIEGAVKLDKTKVVSYTSLLADKLELSGELKLANKFKKIINQDKTFNNELKPMSMNGLYKVPVDQESRLSMADVEYPSGVYESIILNNDIDIQISRFFDYVRNSDKLIGKGITVPNSLLFYGPPGCGKSKLAKYVSQKLNLPLVTSRLDGIVSSYLGSTSKNIRAIFEYAHKIPCVLFLDEFDAIAKVRDDNNELGELKRVVNSLLQNIDGLKNGSILIAASNHEHLLDPAVWRRFNFKLKVDKPDYESRMKLIRLFLKDREIDVDDTKILSHMFRRLSGAEIEEICNKSLIDSVIQDRDINLNTVSIHYFDFIDLKEKMDMDSQNEKSIEKFKAEHLRGIDDKVFSYACIGKILNRSKSHVANLLK